MFSDHFKNTQTPFICLRARLSQVWLDSSVCILALYIVKLVFLKQYLASALDLVQDYVEGSCGALENAANAALNAQSEAVELANGLIKSAVEEAIGFVFKLLSYLALAVQSFVIFFIEITIGTWACLTLTLFNLIATESLDLVEDAVGTLNTTVVAAANDIADFVEKIEDMINDATGLISSITSFITGESTLIGKVNTSLDSLRSLSIPANVTSKIDGLKNDIPTYDDAKDALTSFISTPFTLIRQEINNQHNVSLNISLPSLPTRTTTLCNYSEISKGFDDVLKAISGILWAFIGLCIFAIVGAIAVRMYFVHRRWTRLQTMAVDIDCVVGRTLELQKSANMSAITFGTMTGLNAFFCDKALNIDRHRNTLLWFIQYVCSDAAVAMLYLGISGMIITGIEFIVLHKFRSLSGGLASIVTEPVTNATSQVIVDMVNWREAVNHQISTVSYTVNNQMLGWLSSGTDTLNSTIAKFMDEINSDLNSTLGGTIFYTPVSAVVTCVLGNKVETVEKGLSWVHNNSRISLPTVPWSVVQNVSRVNTSSTILVQSRLDKIVDTIEHQLETQLIVSGVFIGVWILLVIAAAIYAVQNLEPDEIEEVPWSANSTRVFDLRTPRKERATQFFAGPERRVCSQALYVPSPAYKA